VGACGRVWARVGGTALAAGGAARRLRRPGARAAARAG
jgi:hypothetical protein